MDRSTIELELGLELPVNYEKYSVAIQQSIVQYIKQLNT